MLNASDLTEPGIYRYLDPIGAPVQTIEVRGSAPDLIAFFAGIEGDDEVGEIPVQDVSGRFEGPLRPLQR
jgi:hypothetical protein